MLLSYPFLSFPCSSMKIKKAGVWEDCICSSGISDLIKIVLWSTDILIWRRLLISEDIIQGSETEHLSSPLHSMPEHEDRSDKIAYAPLEFQEFATWERWVSLSQCYLLPSCTPTSCKLTTVSDLAPPTLWSLTPLAGECGYATTIEQQLGNKMHWVLSLGRMCCKKGCGLETCKVRARQMESDCVGNLLIGIVQIRFQLVLWVVVVRGGGAIWNV